MKAPIRTFTLALVVMFAPALALAEPAAKFHHVAIEVDAQGRSFFADRESALTPVAPDASAPTQTGLIPAGRISYMRLIPGFVSPWHTAPVRIHLLILQGTMTVETGSGETRTFGAGDVIEFGDQTGQGHKSTVGRDGVLFAMVEIH
jgi:mannose-6-phosphate isomerase-like protein (cupin superfamily)